jgi:hypothetical protein
MRNTWALLCFLALFSSPAAAIADPFYWQGGVYPNIGTEGVVIQSYSPDAPIGPNSVSMMFFPGVYPVTSLAFNTDQTLTAGQILIDNGRGENWTLQQNVRVPGVGTFKWLATTTAPIWGLPIYIDIKEMPNPPALNDFYLPGSQPWFAAQLIGAPGNVDTPGTFWVTSTPEPSSAALSFLAVPTLLIGYLRRLRRCDPSRGLLSR